MRRALFGGSFDPPHLGHLNLALRIMEQKKLDCILFCPAHCSPGKMESPPQAHGAHRMKMVEIALEGVLNCFPLGSELSRPAPSYTIETLDELEGELFLILGEDTIYGLESWKEIERVLEKASPLVGLRHGFESQKLELLPPFIQERVIAGSCKIPAMDISSREIRTRLRNHQFCGHLVQAKVLDYIHQNGLYSS